MAAAANNKQNVSTVRGHAGGYLFSAPVGTTGAPTKTSFKTWVNSVPNGWENLGYIPEDGFTETPEVDSGEAIRDINLEKIDDTDGAVTESLTVAFREIKKHTMGTVYGHANVTDASGTLEVKHRWGQAFEHYQYVFVLLLKDDRVWVKYIPDGKVTGISEVTHNKTTVCDHEVTISYNDDADGTGCYDWIESTETTAP